MLNTELKVIQPLHMEDEDMWVRPVARYLAYNYKLVDIYRSKSRKGYDIVGEYLVEEGASGDCIRRHWKVTFKRKKDAKHFWGLVVDAFTDPDHNLFYSRAPAEDNRRFFVAFLYYLPEILPKEILPAVKEYAESTELR